MCPHCEWSPGRGVSGPGVASRTVAAFTDVDPLVRVLDGVDRRRLRRPRGRVELWPGLRSPDRALLEALDLAAAGVLEVIVGFAEVERGGGPVPHAWVLDPDGVSWEVALDDVAADYLGVPLARVRPDLA